MSGLIIPPSSTHTKKHPNMKFKLVIETNMAINFLEVTIKNLHDKPPTIEIYKKPIEINLLILSDFKNTKQ